MAPMGARWWSRLGCRNDNGATHGQSPQSFIPGAAGHMTRFVALVASFPASAPTGVVPATTSAGTAKSRLLRGWSWLPWLLVSRSDSLSEPVAVLGLAWTSSVCAKSSLLCIRERRDPNAQHILLA